ncbi:MAG: ribonuclease H family protein [Lachnospiraceae bacterium]|nr:ribonuclease H family protein [Lachnospiraceae bacterium]
MAEKKHFYAVKKGRKTGIFLSWDDCRKSVSGFKGAVYKGFVTRQEAEEYLNPCEDDDRLRDIPEDKMLIAYVDGSFSRDKGRYSYGCVFIGPDDKVETMSGSGDDPEVLKIRNVGGEMLGAMHAVKYAYEHGYRSVDICYDYAGIEMWAKGLWKANNPLTQKYAAYMKRMDTKIPIVYHKVAAHTGIEYNELADSLAKQALDQTERR